MAPDRIEVWNVAPLAVAKHLARSIARYAHIQVEYLERASGTGANADSDGPKLALQRTAKFHTFGYRPLRIGG
jgi:hypothetical protein